MDRQYDRVIIEPLWRRWWSIYRFLRACGHGRWVSVRCAWEAANDL